MRGQLMFRAVVTALSTLSATVAMTQGAAPVQDGRTRASASLSQTSWGDPNLQGVWSSGPMSATPFERPTELGTRAVLTEAEFAARVNENRRQAEADSAAFVRPERGGAAIGSAPGWIAQERGKPSMQASLIVDPPNGRLPALTEDGGLRARRWKETADQPAGPEELNPYDRCITRGVLGSAFPNIYNSAARILQTPTEVVIHYEMIHETRIIPLDGRPHAPERLRSYMGDSRGHWEGATLVVETTNFNGRTGSYARNGNGNPTSQLLHLIERFTLAGGDALQYKVRVEDPDTYTAPWTVEFPLTRNDNYAIYEYACHEGNYALPNILRGARAAEGQPVH